MTEQSSRPDEASPDDHRTDDHRTADASHSSAQGTLPGAQGSPEKDPQDWTTGDEPMTGPQASYLQTLAREAGEDLPANLTKAEASEHIDRLQEKTGRGS